MANVAWKCQCGMNLLLNKFAHEVECSRCNRKMIDYSYTINLDNGKIITYPDGHFDAEGLSTGDSGTFTIDEKGNHSFTYVNGDIDIYDSSFFRERTEKANGDVVTYSKSGAYEIKLKNGGKEYYDSSGYKYYYRDNDCSKYFMRDNNEYTLYHDFTFSDGKKKGKYQNSNNGIIFTYEDGTELIYDSHQNIQQKTSSDGVVTYYDPSYARELTNGMVSRMNHIEYDEEEYHHILEVLNNISNGDYGSINTLCSDIDNKIKSFPDSYSGGMVSEIGKNIKGNIDLIGSLSEMTNYSLLAYQTCDENLRNGLYLLIDSLFGDIDEQLGTDFKNSIGLFIEDRDKDGILEYKLDTDFNETYNNFIPRNSYVDENGNILYFNNLNNLLSVDGKNIKVEFGGEVFDLSQNESGNYILKDSNGNSINIFGDYNDSSYQYGGSQVDLPDSLNDPIVDGIISRYYPNASPEEKLALLDAGKDMGCGYIVTTNFVFKNYEGKESEFRDIFGYPMYNVTYDQESDKLFVDYNYEPVTVEMICDVSNYYAGNDIEEATRFVKSGANGEITEKMIRFLHDKKGVVLKDNPDGIRFLGDNAFRLYNEDRSHDKRFTGGHAMTIVKNDEQGRTIVSSWGEKLYYEPLREENEFRTNTENSWQEAIKYGSD